VNLHDERYAVEAGNRSQVAGKAEGKPREQGRVDRVYRTAEEKRLPVWLSRDDVASRHVATVSRYVLDNEGLLQARRKHWADQTRSYVDRPPGGESDDNAYWRCRTASGVGGAGEWR
jgi:hypothetical protein